LKGVGPQRADLLKKELGIFTFKDLLEFYPYRHIDKTQITKISDINYASGYVQIAGKLTEFAITGEKRGKRLVAYLQDNTGELELVWFQGIHWIAKTLSVGTQYLVFGKASFFMNEPQITHPEMEVLNGEKAEGKNFLEPIYPSTEKLKARGLSGRQIGKITYNLFMLLNEKEVPENLPQSIISHLKLIPRFEAFRQIHFPANSDEYISAVRRLKFEELFLSQLRLGILRFKRHNFSKGLLFTRVGDLFTNFYNNYLPFQLTGAQKRV
jgi:ATP-dependent DNA helicase RecG